MVTHQDHSLEPRTRAARLALLISSLFVVMILAQACVGALPTANAYESNWREYVCSGCYAKDTEPPWEHGGYHTWSSAGTTRYLHPVQPKLCIWLYNGSSWEYGSGCNTEAEYSIGYFPYRENALAQSQGWAYNGGSLELIGNAYAP